MAGERDPPDPWAGATQRLHQRALRSSDGFVHALAAQRPCLLELGCAKAVRPERWAQLEPGNISAWLALASASPEPAETWLNGLLQAGYDNNHRAELMALLLALPPQLPPGPRCLARDLALIGLNAASEPRASLRPLSEHCRRGTSAQACRVLVDKLWTLREPSLMSWSQTLGLARLLLPLDPAWEARSREVEAALQWAASETPSANVDFIRHAYQCQADPVFERQALGRLLDGEGRMLLAEIRIRGLAVDSLSAEFRRQNGRSLLQAPPEPATAASATLH